MAEDGAARGAALFGAQLRTYRVAAEVSQAELAELSGVSVRTISDLERGRTRWPHRDSLHRLADALKLDEGARAELMALVGRRLTKSAGDAPDDDGADQVVAHAGPAVPRELPAMVPHFVGRASELTALSELLPPAGAPGAGTVVISAIGGTAGVGKTALALQWAHLAADRFRDGQLYVNLRGYDPDAPVTAAAALAGFLRSLGVPGTDIPQEETERAARYRSLLAGRQLLLVLDNASDEAQVRPLLPGTAGCVTLVTSRNSLSGLVARDGAVRLGLDMLPADDAVALLARLIGARSAGEPAATRALAEACGRLPLALRVAAELAARRAEPLKVLVDELAGQRRLDMLDAGGDARTAIRAVFSWSYRHLDEQAARVFRLAALHPGLNFDRYAVAALAGLDAREAGRLLDVLVGAYLIEPAGPGRYGLHDLLRAYARELTAGDEQREPMARLLHFYRHASAAATQAVYPGDPVRRPSGGGPEFAHPGFASDTAGLAWLDTERASLVAAAEYAVSNGIGDYAIELSATLFRYLNLGCYTGEERTLHQLAREAAVRQGDTAAEAESLINLGSIDFRLGLYDQVAECYERAVGLYASIGDRAGQARALHNLGLLEGQQGDDTASSAHLEGALAQYRQIADRVGEGRALADLGLLDIGNGRYRQASEHFEQALALSRATGDRVAELTVVSRQAGIDMQLGDFRRLNDRLERSLVMCAELGDRYHEACALSQLGHARVLQGRYQQAVGYLERALAQCRDIGYRGGEVDALDYLGLAELGQGRHDAAVGLLERALAVALEIADPERQAEVLNALGEAALADAQPGKAREWHTSALAAIDGCRVKYEEARALRGLGDAYHASGDPARAEDHWRRAHDIFAALGVPEPARPPFAP